MEAPSNGIIEDVAALAKIRASTQQMKRELPILLDRVRKAKGIEVVNKVLYADPPLTRVIALALEAGVLEPRPGDGSLSKM